MMVIKSTYANEQIKFNCKQIVCCHYSIFQNYLTLLPAQRHHWSLLTSQEKKYPFMTNRSYICYTKIYGTQDAVRLLKRVKLVKYNSTRWNDWMSCLLLLPNWNDTDLEVFHNFSHRELKVHSSVLLEPLLLFNGICRTSMGWNCLRNLRIQLFTMQGLMITFFILQSFTFYVFPTFLDNKKIINTDGTFLQ